MTEILITAVLAVCAAVLTAAGGKRLRAVDQWYAEVVILGMALAGLVVYWGINLILYGTSAGSRLDLAAGAVICGMMCFPLFIGLGSLIRRARSHGFSDRFLFVRACRTLADDYGRRNDRMKSGLMSMISLGFLALDTLIVFAGAAAWFGRRRTIAGILGILWLILNAMYLLTISKRGSQMKTIFERIETLSEGDVGKKLDTSEMHGDIRRMAEQVNSLDLSLERAVSERISSERMKTDLIANVSHDLRTPLTSIINYVDLLKREQIPDPRVQEYLSVLESKSMRLKHMTEMLMEASRASSGSMKITWERIDMVQLVRQVYGEFQEKMEDRGLIPLVRLIDPPAVILADGQILWRVLDNLYTNVCKYGRPGTQVLIELQETAHNLVYTMKNVSDAPIRYSSSELMERFTRGEDSRTTEGSGLGLSIARSMTEQLHGKFELYSDEEMFRVRLVFPLAEEDSGEKGSSSEGE